MSISTLNIRKNIGIFQEGDSDKIIQKFERKMNKSNTLQNDNYQKEILKRLTGNCVLGFMKNLERRDTAKTAISESDINYDLCMINKFDENLNSSLSFISEFDLEEDEKEFDNSFNSSENDNSVEQIDIKKKNIKKTQAEKDEEEINLENEWNDIQELILNKKLS